MKGSFWPKRIFFGMIAAFIFLALTACSNNWYGSGYVLEKKYKASYMYLSYCGKGCLIPITHPECYWMRVQGDDGEQHEGCVRSKFWEDTPIGRHVVLSEATARN